jgi:hypothetical protein
MSGILKSGRVLGNIFPIWQLMEKRGTADSPSGENDAKKFKKLSG